MIHLSEDEMDETKDPTRLNAWRYRNLRRAIDSGDVIVTSELLSQGVQLNNEDLNGAPSTLFMAINKGNSAIIELLLNHDENIEQRTGFMEITPLHYAVHLGNGQPEIVNLLLEKGANVKAKDRVGMTALHMAAQLGYAEIAQLLTNFNADINARTGFLIINETPLSLAAKNGHADVVMVLLCAGACTEYQHENDPEPPLFCASEKGYESIVQQLLDSGADITVRQRQSPKALSIHLAAMNGHCRVVELLLKYTEDISIRATNDYIDEVCGFERRSPLLLAADKGYDSCVRCLLANGANIESKDSDGNTALDLALYNKHESVSILLLEKGADFRSLKSIEINPFLITAAATGQALLVQWLLDMDFDMEVSNVIGQTALHHAAKVGHMECLELLLKRGANLHAVDIRGQTCLHLAVQSGNINVVSLLVNMGANLNAMHSSAQTCLALASGKGHDELVEFILKTNTDVEANNLESALCLASSNGHQISARLLLDSGANVNGPNGIRYWNSPLFRAISRGHDKVVELLLNYDADPVVSYLEAQQTVRDAAILSGKVAMVQRFLGPSIDIYERDMYGQTILHKAALHGHLAIVQLLIASGARLDAITKLGWLPIHGAALNGHREVVLLLLKKGSEFGSLEDMFEMDLRNLYQRNHNALLRLFTEHSNAWKALQLVVLNNEDTSAVSALQLHVKHGGKINCASKNGEGITVLHTAAKAGNETVIQRLLSLKQVDIDSQCAQGNTALHTAISFGHTGVVEILLNHAASVDCTDFHGNTPLHHAVFAHHEKVVQRLIQKNLVADIPNNTGVTALQYAKAKNMSTICALLSNL